MFKASLSTAGVQLDRYAGGSGTSSGSPAQCSCGTCCWPAHLGSGGCAKQVCAMSSASLACRPAQQCIHIFETRACCKVVSAQVAPHSAKTSCAGRRLVAMSSALAAVRGAADALQGLVDDQEAELGTAPSGLLAQACSSVPAETHPCWDALATMAAALEETVLVRARQPAAVYDMQGCAWQLQLSVSTSVSGVHRAELATIG